MDSRPQNNTNPCDYIKLKKHILIQNFMLGIDTYKDNALICMAGSSGSGKTEVATYLIKLISPLQQNSIVRIDADEVKTWLHQEIGADVNDCHGAAVLGVEKNYDHCLKNGISCIIDGTFADYSKGENNIKRAIKKRFSPIILTYVYQKPERAWEFIKIRERKTGRKVAREVFENSFIQSINNVLKIKRQFQENVIIYFVEKVDDELNFKMNVDVNFLKARMQIVDNEHSKF